ncbi:uncharacterized protein LOC132376785 [Balaenoptera ricei]|uniref:uncharacterized protein LOC132376785 n=1 Tax=Balaenoptera ricei TaxID=2746895 RepID=UPI0028BF081D|nr:uncharacterized protein LOC132376785 [Balaenoptera ricei]
MGTWHPAGPRAASLIERTEREVTDDTPEIRSTESRAAGFPRDSAEGQGSGRRPLLPRGPGGAPALQILEEADSRTWKQRGGRPHRSPAALSPRPGPHAVRGRRDLRLPWERAPTLLQTARVGAGAPEHGPRLLRGVGTKGSGGLRPRPAVAARPGLSPLPASLSPLPHETEGTGFQPDQEDGHTRGPPLLLKTACHRGSSKGREAERHQGSPGRCRPVRERLDGGEEKEGRNTWRPRPERGAQRAQPVRPEPSEAPPRRQNLDGEGRHYVLETPSKMPTEVKGPRHKDMSNHRCLSHGLVTYKGSHCSCFDQELEVN